MRLVIYEWCCSGGVSGDLVSEGRTMFEAVVADALRERCFEVTALVSETCPLRLPAGVRVRSVPPGADREALVAAAAAADISLVIAPETDGVLADRVAGVRAAGGTPLACDASFLDLAADKQATVTALAAAGVPVAAGRALAPGEPWPVGFHVPAVGKARQSAGCEGFVVVRHGDRPPPASIPLRIETLVPGMPVGVSCLCGPAGIHPLPPLQQVCAAGGTPRYLGAVGITDAARGGRAAELARRAVAAVARASGGAARGWVGVDMILGARSDGTADRVLEVNPRLTTSFAHHARDGVASLLATAIRIAAGSTLDEPGAARTAETMRPEVACP
jgi:hypothetical protein